MKKSILFTLIIFAVIIGTATNFPSGNKIEGLMKGKCVAIHPFELKEGVDVAEFEEFMITKILSIYNKVNGQEAVLIKGDRGQRTGKYAVMLTFDDVEKRNEIYPPEGGISKEFQDAGSGHDEDWAKISDYVVGNFWDNHTDYFVVQLEE